MKYYKDDDVLPTMLIAMLVGLVVVMALHHKNETAYHRAVIAQQDAAIIAATKCIERQAQRIENYKTILRAMPPQEFRNQKGERI